MMVSECCGNSYVGLMDGNLYCNKCKKACKVRPYMPQSNLFRDSESEQDSNGNSKEND